MSYEIFTDRGGSPSCIGTGYRSERTARRAVVAYFNADKSWREWQHCHSSKYWVELDGATVGEVYSDESEVKP